MSSLTYPLYKSLYSTITFKKAMVVVCSVLLLINSVGTAVAGNPFFNQTTRAATTSSNANQPLINQQLYGFDGQLSDPESGYQFLGRGYHRAYNPVTRRFMSQDSMSPFSKGGFNGYIFARNNPIMHQDPSGHMSSNFWLNIVGILGAIAGAVLAPFTGGSTAVIAAGEVVAVTGATAGSLGAAGAATHNKALEKASLGLGIASAAIDAVNIIGSGAKLAAGSVDAGATAASNGSEISTTVGGGAAKIAVDEDHEQIFTPNGLYSRNEYEAMEKGQQEIFRPKAESFIALATQDTDDLGYPETSLLTELEKPEYNVDEDAILHHTAKITKTTRQQLSNLNESDLTADDTFSLIDTQMDPYLTKTKLNANIKANAIKYLDRYEQSFLDTELYRIDNSKNQMNRFIIGHTILQYIYSRVRIM